MYKSIRDVREMQVDVGCGRKSICVFSGAESYSDWRSGGCCGGE